MLRRLGQPLRAKPSRLQPVRRVEIPKPQGGPRPRGVAPVEDRVVPTAMHRSLEPLFAADCHACSYGDRPQRGARTASGAIREALSQPAWSVVEIACRSYWTTMPPDKLLSRMRQRVSDGSMLRLLPHSLKVGVVYQGQGEPTKGGVPQGSPIAPLSSTIYLTLLDQIWHKRAYPQKLGAPRHRYCDDVILVCRKNATQALEAFEAMARRMGRESKHEKTRLTTLIDGFDGIGYQFGKRRSPPTGKWSSDLFPSQESQHRIRRRITYCTKRRSPASPEEFVRQITEAVQGGGQYYIHTHASQAVRALQRVINTRFRRYLTYRSKGRGFGWRR